MFANLFFFQAIEASKEKSLEKESIISKNRKCINKRAWKNKEIKRIFQPLLFWSGITGKKA